MNSLSDQQLLRDYTELRSEAAFTELVRRHVEFVYSAALRMVRDVHLAEDVTQASFVALAENARKLTDHPVLSGWLHRTAQNLAVKTVRSEARRRAREEEAAVMNELIGSDIDASWEQIAPYLDAALSELSEPDRNALFLRYFQRKSAREMAQMLGVSDEAAQKRVNRAVEKLRELFLKRGLTVAASGLVVVLSTHAVHSAPVGAIATISSAVFLAGTTAQTSTAIATTKTIAMTSLQKTFITATIALVAGAGIYEARRASQLREQNQTLEQRQAPLIAQLQQLQLEHDAATNRLSTVTSEMAQLKSGQNQSELLKLRGQVGTLQRQLASTETKSNSSNLKKMLADPDPVTKELINQQAWREIKLRFADLFQELKLSPEQIETFAQTYANPSMRNASDAEVESQLRSLLGEAGYARFQEFTQEVPTRATMKLLKSQLGANQLTEEQSSRLWKIVKAEPYDLTYGIEGDLPEALRGSKDDVSHHLQQVAESNQHVVQQAGAFLTPDQLVALQTVFTNALKTRAAQAAALAQKP